MPELSTPHGDQKTGILRSAPVRTGIYTGVFLSVCFATWVLVANRVPELEPLAFARNVGATGLMAIAACVPVMRFYSSPGELLSSGLLGWSLLTLTFRLLCIKFDLLDESYSTFQIFVIGSVCYLIVATLAWIGTIIRRARASHISHTNH